MQLLAKHVKNARIIVWSGGGRDYATQIVRRYGLEKYVDRVYGKPVNTPRAWNTDGAYDYDVDGPVDICFDDIHSCTLADKNIIVKMK